MKKTILSLLLCVVVLLSLCPNSLVYAANGTLSATTTSKSVTIGQTVTITLKYNGNKNKIAAIYSTISYNATAFSYQSSNGTEGTSASGNAGVVRALFEMPSSGVLPTVVNMDLTFKAIAPGNLNLEVETSEFSVDMGNNQYSSLGSPAATLSVSAINPTKSGNANLASLKPSSGTLVPKFSPNTTNYTISVPYTTTSLSLSATTADKGAKTSVSGKNALSVGKNTQVITVTAANGTTKKYTVVITRSANQSTANKYNSHGTENTTTTTTPAENPLEVEVGGVLMTLSDTQPDVTLPAGFAWGTVEVNQVQVAAAKNEKIGMTLLHLTNAADKTAGLYIYNETTKQFTPFRSLTTAGSLYVLLDMPAGQTAPAGTVSGKLEQPDGTIAAFTYEDTAWEDFYIVYAISPEGNTGLYVYDKKENTLQRHREISLPALNEQPEPTTPSNKFVTFVTTHRTTILLCAAAGAALAFLVGAIVLLIVLTRKPSIKCKH